MGKLFEIPILISAGADRYDTDKKEAARIVPKQITEVNKKHKARHYVWRME